MNKRDLCTVSFRQLRTAVLILFSFSFFTNSLTSQSNLNLRAPDMLELNCNLIDFNIINSWLNSYTVIDTCQGNVQVTNDFDGVLPELCSEPKIVKWIARNNCGGLDSAESILTLENSFFPIEFTFCPPVITVFADTANCGSTVTFPSPFATDCFGLVDVNQISLDSFPIIASGQMFPPGGTPVLFEATDACGRRDSCQFEIVVLPSTEFIDIECYEEQELRVCADIGDCQWTGTTELLRPISALQTCDSVTFSYSILLPDGVLISSSSRDDNDGDPSGYRFPQGKSTICYSIENNDINDICCMDVLVEDCEAPSLICPGTATVDCAISDDAEALNDWLDQAIVNDNCDSNPTFSTAILDTLSGCGGNELIEYLVFARDSSGNEKACISTLNLMNTDLPTINVVRLPDTIVQCVGEEANQQIFLDWLNRDAGFNDEHITSKCPVRVSWSFVPSSTAFQVEANGCSDRVGFYDVEFFAEDDCGNRTSNSAKARMVIEDNLPPLVMIADTLQLDCDISDIENKIEQLVENNLVVVDSCSTFEVRATFNLDFECALGSNPLEVMVNATDLCGNTVQTSTVVNLIRSDNSTITSPPDLFLRCGQPIDSLIENWLDEYTVTAKCDSISVINNYMPELNDLCGGVQQVIWVLRDTCGATTTAVANLTIIEDDIAPVFLNCPTDVTINLGETDCLSNFLFDTPKAEDCNGDRVNISQVLPPTGQPIYTSGSDFPIGITRLEFIATDVCENESSCSFLVTVNDDSRCEGIGITISGNVQTAIGDAFQNVTLRLDSDQAEFPMSQQTNANGDYTFPALAPRNDYSISLAFEDDFSNGLSTVDMLMIRNHIIGLDVFEAPYKVVAADLSNDGNLSVTDLVLLQKLILGTQDSLSNGAAWKFADRNELLEGNLIPFPQIDVFSYDDLRSAVIANFIGIKSGDVNSSAAVNGLDASEIRSLEEIVIQDKQMEDGGLYQVAVTMSSPKFIEGFQLAFDYNSIEIIDIEAADFSITESNYVIRKDYFNINGVENIGSTNDAALFYIKLKSHADQFLSDALSLKSNGLTPEAYVSEDLEIVSLKLEYEDINEPLSIVQISPNPFNESAELYFSALSNSPITLSVYSLTGELLYQAHKPFTHKSNGIFTIDHSDLSYKGLCFVELSDGKNVVTSKLISLSE